MTGVVVKETVVVVVVVDADVAMPVTGVVEKVKVVVPVEQQVISMSKQKKKYTQRFKYIRQPS